jgi:hypothetical protein
MRKQFAGHYRSTGTATSRRLQAAKRHGAATRQQGRRNGSLGRPAVDILRALALRFGRSGKCFPSYAVIREHTRYPPQVL